MIRVGLFNSNGLSGKVEMCKKFYMDELLDIFFIVETKLSANATGYGQAFLNITRRTPFSNSRGFGNIGGIMGWCSPRLDGLCRVVDVEKDNCGAIVEVADEMMLVVGYFPPEEHNQGMSDRMLDYFERAKEMAGDKPLVILGDFNARLGTLTGDHALNGRGRKLISWLRGDGSGLTIENPVSGRFTSFTHWGRGAGITEIVLSKSVDVCGYRVMEHNSLGGSDHRPLVFELGVETPPPRTFTRWDVKKLANLEMRQLYADTLKTKILESQALLNSLPDVESYWMILKNVVETAIDETVGRFSFSRSSLLPHFWTPELVALRERVRIEEESWYTLFQQSNGRMYNETVRRGVVDRNQELRDALKKRRRELFLEEVEEFDDPQQTASFLKRIKCKKARMTKNGCQLDSKRMSDHARHFGATFGASPRIQPQENIHDPVLEDAVNMFTLDEVKRALEWAAVGKTPGCDGIHGEFWRYGADSLARPIHRLFNQLYTECTIIEEWKEAIIVPIFKKKGDANDAKNYRPIALTCVIRRIYERLLNNRLLRFNEMLSPFQAGFRKNRNTLQQVYNLSEIQHHHPELHTIFIDIKTAYDSVNRNILWQKLNDEFRIPLHLIKNLQALFDNNRSTLVINGTKSEPIPNLRGLLQGSSLSPMLFNFYINSLLKSFDDLDDSLKVNTHGIVTNHLFFADDGNIHALCLKILKKLLNMVESWAIHHDLELSASKSVYLGPASEIESRTLRLYGTSLEKVLEFEYLGVIMDMDGVNWSKNAAKRCNATRNTFHILKRVGMNPTGWPWRASAQAYKTFLRPMMEYGLAVGILSPSQLRPYQLTQNYILRHILGAPRNCSSNALHKLLLIERMEFRNFVLNGNFIGNIHNSTSYTLPSARIYRAIINNCNHRQSPTQKALKKNQLKPELSLIAHLFHPLEHQPHDGPIVRPLSHEKKRQKKLDHIKNLAGAVAQAITVDEQIHRDIVTLKDISQQQRVTVSRWILGLVCQHQVCRNCNGDLSRRHGVLCSGAHTYLHQVYDRYLNIESEENVIDQLLNRFRARAPDTLFYGHITHAIGLIYVFCRGFEMCENGFWKKCEDTAVHDHHIGSRHSTPPPSNQESDWRPSIQGRRISSNNSRLSWRRSQDSTRTTQDPPSPRRRQTSPSSTTPRPRRQDTSTPIHAHALHQANSSFSRLSRPPPSPARDGIG